MIYRYRVVAADYRAANAFDAPLMPGFGGAELSAKANAIHRDIDVLRGKLASLTGVAATVNPNSGIASSTTSGATTPGAGDQSVSAAAVNADQTAASGGTGQSATAAPPAPDQAAAASIDQTVAAIADGGAGPGSPAATSPDAAGASAGSFVQDTSPPSAPLADCCAAAMQQLQTDTAGFVAQVPQVTSQTRPLNLIIAGLQLAATLINQGQSLWSQFKVLKHAPSPQAAMQALQQLSTTLSTVQQASSNGLQNPGGWFAANAPASFTQDVGTTTTGAVVGNPVPGTLPAQTAAQQSGAQPQSSGTNPQQNPTQNTVDQTLDNAKQKLKNKLKWPH